MSVVKIENLSVEFPSRRGNVLAVRDVSLEVAPGEVLGLVGESGAGKSTVGNALINLLEPPGRIVSGKVLFDGADLTTLDDEALRGYRGKRIGMIFQDPQTSLNPLMTVGEQLIETLRSTKTLDAAAAQAEAISLLESVGISEPHARLRAYPHQFSGGMRQRVVIALTLSGDPDLVIADEPTTALDVSIQAQILALIKSLCASRQLGVILVTHDIGVIAEIADRVAVMYNGEVVETGNVAQVIGAPVHDYTKSLIAAVPRGDRKLDRFTLIDYIEGGSDKLKPIDIETHWLGERTGAREHHAEAALQITDIDKRFVLKRAFLRRHQVSITALDKVSFAVRDGESFGLVGESGSGKSTIARVIAGLFLADSGSVTIRGQDMLGAPKSDAVKAVRRDVQMIFQDPYSSLNARMRVRDIVAEPIRFHRSSTSEDETRQIVSDLLEHVGLPRAAELKYPHEFSGGQRQRISIARALASRPRILICDEPTSALDVSVQATILNLLKDLQAELGLTMLFISHDLPVIRQMCDRVAVMRHGKICEIAETNTLFDSPQHEYSRHLLDLMPSFSTLGEH